MLVDERATLIAKVAELHGRATEISRRMLRDARVLADVQQEMLLVLDELWGLRTETASPEPAPRGPRMLREAQVTPESIDSTSAGGRELVKHRYGVTDSVR